MNGAKRQHRGGIIALRVFLAEDESIIRETLRDTVPWAQYGCVFAGEAGDGEMALPLIRQAKPDVLITDIRMPFIDGLALSELVSREFPEMKIVIISGYNDFEYSRKAISIGVDRYLIGILVSMLLGFLSRGTFQGMGKIRRGKPRGRLKAVFGGG